MATHSFERTREQHVQVVYIESAVYQSLSKSDSEWASADRDQFGNDMIITRSCNGWLLL